MRRDERVTDEMVAAAQAALSNVRYGLTDTEMRAALSAALSIERTQPVKVKALRWVHHDGNYPTWRALAPHFEAVIDKGEPRMYGDFPLIINGRMSKEKYDTLEAAQVAAQDNFEQRVGDFLLSTLVNADGSASTSKGLDVA